jgi:Tfp pilus assembly protein PilX
MRKINFKKYKTEKNRGVTLYITLAVTGALLLVSFAVVTVSLKQLDLSGAARDSQAAFFAADSGIECALYWDVKSASKPFATSTAAGASISCNGVNTTTSRTYSGTGPATTTFSITPDPCISVTVVKTYTTGGVLSTKIESRGYNNCTATSPFRVERAIRASY